MHGRHTGREGNTGLQMGVSMQSYIVRIYRRGRNTLLGMVETSDDRTRRAFTDYDELWEILNSSRGEYLKARSGHSRKRRDGTLRGKTRKGRRI